MMGRVCFEEGSPEATAAHMKGDAVAEAASRKNLKLLIQIKTLKKLPVNKI